jgi:hypothetical protein
MIKNMNEIAEDLFNKIRSRFSNVKLGDENGKVTEDPQLARYIDFEYKDGGETIGHVNVSLDENEGLVVYYSSEFVSEEGSTTKDNWYNFLRELRQFSKKRMLNFDTRDITRSNLEKRDYQFLTKNAGETTMSESKLYGTARRSYQDLGGSTLIVTHSKPVNQEIAAGRSQYIESIFVENESGERFKYPVKHLNGARALGRHVANGGTPYDNFGSHIIEMSQELGKLSKFKRYINRSGVMAENIGPVAERVAERMIAIKKELTDLQKPNYYKEAFENFDHADLTEVPQDVQDSWIEALTIKTFQEEIKDVFPYLYKIMEIHEVTPQDLLDEEDDIVVKETTEKNFLEELERTLEELVAEDQNSLFSKDSGESEQAIKTLQDLISEEFPAGIDGMNAVESLQGIIDDPMLNDMFRKVGKKDSNTDVRGLIEKYIKMKNPSVLEKLDFGNQAQAAAPEAPAAAPEAPAAGTAPAESEEECGVRSAPQQQTPLSELILSYFDKETGKFPKGETAILTMVEKDYGDQYVKPAQQFIEKIQHKFNEVQEVNGTSELDRVRSLAGLK